MPRSATIIGMLLPHSTKLKMIVRRSLGSSRPPIGHSLETARRKKYEAMSPAKSVPSVMIKVTTPHHAVGRPSPEAGWSASGAGAAGADADAVKELTTG